MKIQFDINRIREFKDIIQRQHSEDRSSIKAAFEKRFKDATEIEILLMEQELVTGDYGIAIENIKDFSRIYPSLNDYELDQLNIEDEAHPIQIFIEENKALQNVIAHTTDLLTMFEQKKENEDTTVILEKLKEEMTRLGEFRKHYDRKEKLLFPILERYGHYTPTRIMWRGDEQVSALYKAAKYHIDGLPQTPLEHLHMTYDSFKRAFIEMILHEEVILLPILARLFKEEDWYKIAEESEAFGYSLIDVEEGWTFDYPTENRRGNIKQDIPFGGGYLTTEEANLILNHLPLEITFVDKHSVFKYFNNITAASDMMLVRTPISIGRNVANCHPPKSLKKVMTLVRDLKTKKRTSESMWFKMKGKYIHLTYKALFNEEGEYLGILEYVQDIQPFFELPTEIKRGLTPIDE